MSLQYVIVLFMFMMIVFHFHLLQVLVEATLALQAVVSFRREYRDEYEACGCQKCVTRGSDVLGDEQQIEIIDEQTVLQDVPDRLDNDSTQETWWTFCNSLHSARNFFLCPSRKTSMGFYSRSHSCVMDSCVNCGLSKKWLECLVDHSTMLQAKWRQYGKVTEANGYVTEALVDEEGTGDQLMQHVKEKLDTYFKHYFKYRWLSNIMDHDIDTFTRDTLKVFFC